MKKVLKIIGIVLLAAIIAVLVWDNVQMRKKLDEYTLKSQETNQVEQLNQEPNQVEEVQQEVKEVSEAPQKAETPPKVEEKAKPTLPKTETSAIPSLDSDLAEGVLIEKSPTCAKCGDSCFEGHTYCRKHECSEPMCEELNVTDSYMGYCAEHKCALCDDNRSFGSKFCYRHKCSSCGEAVVKGSNYCYEHKCKLCDNSAGFDGFCYRHDD